MCYRRLGKIGLIWKSSVPPWVELHCESAFSVRTRDSSCLPTFAPVLGWAGERVGRFGHDVLLCSVLIVSFFLLYATISLLIVPTYVLFLTFMLSTNAA